MNVESYLQSHGRPMLIVSPDIPLSEMARRFGIKVGGRKHTVAMVCEANHRMVGILSLGDVVHALFVHREKAADLPVRDIMTTTVLTAGLGDEIMGVLRQMTEQDVMHVPVLKDGALVGLVARRDALEYLVDEEAMELNQLRSYVFRSGGRY